MRLLCSKSGRSLVIGAALLAALLATGPASGAQNYWFETYERMVALIDDGQLAEASTLLDDLLRDHPYPIACLRIPGDRCVDYLPYYQRARIQLAMGNLSAATHSLDIEGAFGAVHLTKRTAAAFTTLRQQIKVKTAETSSGHAQVAPASRPH